MGWLTRVPSCSMHCTFPAILCRTPPAYLLGHCPTRPNLGLGPAKTIGTEGTGRKIYGG